MYSIYFSKAPIRRKTEVHARISMSFYVSGNWYHLVVLQALIRILYSVWSADELRNNAYAQLLFLDLIDVECYDEPSLLVS